MTAEHIKEYIAKLKQDPKVDIFHIYKGITAVNKVKRMEFTNPEEADKWVSQWTSAEKKSSCVIIYSELKRVNKIIRYKFFIGDSALGSKFTYAAGMKLLSTF